MAWLEEPETLGLCVVSLSLTWGVGITLIKLKKKKTTTTEYGRRDYTRLKET